MTCTRPQAIHQILLAIRASSTHGPKTPITVPQIWMDGAYVGGADELGKMLGYSIEAGDNARQSGPVVAEPEAVPAAA